MQGISIHARNYFLKQRFFISILAEKKNLPILNFSWKYFKSFRLFWVAVNIRKSRYPILKFQFKKSYSIKPSRYLQTKYHKIWCINKFLYIFNVKIDPEGRRNMIIIWLKYIYIEYLLYFWHPLKEFTQKVELNPVHRSRFSVFRCKWDKKKKMTPILISDPTFQK